MAHYKLDQTEQDIIKILHHYQQATFSGVLSSIATKNGYKLSDHTRFELAPEMNSLTVTEQDDHEPVVTA